MTHGMKRIAQVLESRQQNRPVPRPIIAPDLLPASDAVWRTWQTPAPGQPTLRRTSRPIAGQSRHR